MYILGGVGNIEMGKIKDISGQKFGRLIVIDFNNINHNKGATWNCICSCGKKTIVDGRYLRRGSTTSCGCYARESYRNPNKSMNDYYFQIKAQANYNGKTFSLTKKEFSILVQKKCNYCGNMPTNKFNPYLKKDGTVRSKRYENYDISYLESLTILIHGLDRVDSDKGYSVDNVVPCCWKCNMFKNTLSLSEFLEHVNKIYKYRNNEKF